MRYAGGKKGPGRSVADGWSENRVAKSPSGSLLIAEPALSPWNGRRLMPNGKCRMKAYPDCQLEGNEMRKLKFVIVCPAARAFRIDDLNKQPSRRMRIFRVSMLSALCVAASAPDDVETEIVDENVEPIDLDSDADIVELFGGHRMKALAF